MQDIRLLIVDDHSELRKLMAASLQKQDGIGEIIEADNGVEALRIIAENRVDVLITDLVMPHMDGYTLLDEMQKLTIDHVPKAIVVTALGRDDFVMRAIERGAAYYMIKPYDSTQLYARILEVAGYETHETPVQLLSPTQRTQSLDERLGGLFLTIGIPAHIK